MKQIIRDYFTFNKRERSGIFVLLSIIGLQLVYLNIAEEFYSVDQTDFSAFEKTLKELEKWKILAASNDSAIRVEGAKTKKLFSFDPNTAGAEDWAQLGLQERQIKVVLNFVSKGGKFRHPEDLKKMFCLSAEQADELIPFVKIRNEEKIFDRNIPQTGKVIVELNTADSAMLTTVRGIGPFYAKSIVKYRKELHGYLKKEQLMEIWKFDEEKFNKVKDHISVDPALVKKVNVNSCTADELKHPYLKWNSVNAIISYRKNHGPYKTVDEIRNTDLVDEETLRKIAGYLSTE
jgi:DNA uptake protein ComE-like DNA-binding protein